MTSKHILLIVAVLIVSFLAYAYVLGSPPYQDPGTFPAVPEQRIPEQQPIPPDVPVWDTLTNTAVGIRLEYPDMFQYGVSNSTRERFQISTYDMSQYESEGQFPGMKLELMRFDGQDGQTLLEFASQTASYDEEITFMDTQIDGLPALSRFVQENATVIQSFYFAKGTSFYIIYLVGDAAQYQHNKQLLDEMIEKIEVL